MKAWNAIPSATFGAKGAPAGDPKRLAIPVAADDDADPERRDKAMAVIGKRMEAGDSLTVADLRQ